MLYQRGLSTGDFKDALGVLLGDKASGLPPSSIARMTATWEEEYRSFRRRDLSEKHYVYVWADGVHSRVRLDIARAYRALSPDRLVDVRELNQSRQALGRDRSSASKPPGEKPEHARAHHSASTKGISSGSA